MSAKKGMDIRSFFARTPKKEENAVVNSSPVENHDISKLLENPLTPSVGVVESIVASHAVVPKAIVTSPVVKRPSKVLEDSEDEEIIKKVKRSPAVNTKVKVVSSKKGSKFDDDEESSASDVHSESSDDFESDGSDQDDTNLKNMKDEDSEVEQKVTKKTMIKKTVDVTPKKAPTTIKKEPASSPIVHTSTSESASFDFNEEFNFDDMLPSFVRAANIRDNMMRRPDHPEYNKVKLHVPEVEYKKMTPAQKQFWEIKSANMDVVLFFKVGKFYELFDVDAETGVRELGLVKMSGERLHAGFPEAGFAKYAQILVKKGFKVGRVEQTQTPKQLAEMNAKAGKGQKVQVVKREMCQMLSKSTVTDASVIGKDESPLLLVISEHLLQPDVVASTIKKADGEQFVKQDSIENAVVIGMVLVDVSTGRIQVDSFVDNDKRSVLMSSLGMVNVEEVLEVATTSFSTKRALNDVLPIKVQRSPVSLDDCVDIKKMDAYLSSTYKDHGIPSVLLDFQGVHKDVVYHAYGMMQKYLQRMMVLEEVIPLQRVEKFHNTNTSTNNCKEYISMDQQTQINLNILHNEHFNKQGSLLRCIDKSCTAFGRRKLAEWVVRPLGNVARINERLDAVEELLSHFDLVNTLRNKMKKVVDLERLLSRVHASGLKKEQTAVMYENVGKMQVDAFLKTLQGFHALLDVLLQFQKEDWQSQIQSNIANIEVEGHADALKYIKTLQSEFESAFDHKQASSDGYIVPQKGIVDAYDEAELAVKNAEKALDCLLEREGEKWGRGVTYFHRAKEVYQQEIPVTSLEKRKIGVEYEQVSTTKKVKRFYTSELKGLIATLEDAQDTKSEILKDTTRQVFAKFARDHTAWSACVDALATLDCLFCFTLTSAQQSPSCRPVFVQAAEPLLDVKNGIHPTMAASVYTSGASAFIPNDVAMGTEQHPQKILLMSGPNMGGKSTLLRQVCLLTIQAHLGCYVTAESMTLSPVDAIYTRIGAADRIMQGQSTFLMELAETSTILQKATKHSLVIMDELGRGTATFDGTAIAHGVLQYLRDVLQCRTLFATHYHSLLSEAEEDMRRCYMACNVNDTEDIADQKIVFMYKLVDGISARSFGINVAKLAGIPTSVVTRAHEMAKKLEYCLQSQNPKLALLHVTQMLEEKGLTLEQ